MRVGGGTRRSAGRMNRVRAGVRPRLHSGRDRPGATRTRGWFITIEGPEGAGKTTQAERLAPHLEARGHRRPRHPRAGRHVARRAAPRGPPGPDRRRRAATDPLTDAFLFNAARRQLVTEVIRPALAAGRTVVCARYADSTLAYQGYGAGRPARRPARARAAATDGLRPDLTILLDLPVEVGLARKAPGRRDPLRGRVRPRLPSPGPGRLPGPGGGRTRAASRSSTPAGRRTRWPRRWPRAVDAAGSARSEPRTGRPRASTDDTGGPSSPRLRVSSPADEADRAVLVRLADGELDALEDAV